MISEISSSTKKIRTEIQKSVTFASISSSEVILDFLLNRPLVIILLHNILKFQVTTFLCDGFIQQNKFL